MAPRKPRAVAATAITSLPAQEEQGIQVHQENGSVESLISQAIAGNVPVETLERLFSLRERVNAERAKAAFVEALATFQSQCPIIEKTKKVLNKDGRSVRYQYAPLDAIVNQIKKPLADNKLSYSWDVKHADNHMSVTVKITHVLGHSETSSLDIPISPDGYMTEPQKYASAQTYAKRYTLLNGLGITTADEDTDASDVGKEKDARSPKAKIMFRLRTLKQPTKTKEEIEAAVTKLTGLTLEDKNFEEIVTRLDVIIAEQHEDTTIR